MKPETKNCIEVVSILKRYGFVEYTKDVDIEHYNKLQRMREYNPSSVKRYFRKGHVDIIFDYENFQFLYSGAVVLYSVRKEIPLNQLVSILFFAKRDAQQKMLLRKKIGDDFKIAYLYEYLLDFKGLTNSKYGEYVNKMADWFELMEYMKNELLNS